MNDVVYVMINSKMGKKRKSRNYLITFMKIFHLKMNGKRIEMVMIVYMKTSYFMLEKMLAVVLLLVKIWMFL